MNNHSKIYHYIQQGLQIILVLALSAAFFLVIYRYDNKYTFRSPQAKDGILTLDSPSLAAHPVIFLIDGWEYYGGRLLTPEDFPKNSRPVPDQYMFIGQFGGFEKWNGGSPHGSASYRLNIRVPDSPACYQLELPEIFSAYRLYINGCQIAQMGEPEPDTYRPETGNRLVSIEAGGNIEILFAVSDFSHLYSGIVYPPAFGQADAVAHLLNGRLIFRSILCAAVVTIGLLSVMIGLLARKDTLAPLFGLLCLTFVGFAGYPLFRTILTGLHFLYLIENVSFCLMLAIAMLIAIRTGGLPFGYGLPFVFFGSIVCILSVVMHLLLPLGHLEMMLAYSRLISVYQWITAIFITVTTRLAVRKGTAYLSPLLYAALILACALIMDRLLPVHEPILTGWFIELASFILVLCIGIVTGHETASRYREHSVLQERTANMERLYQTQASYYQTIKQEVEQAKTMRHDMHHHLTIMDRYIKEGHYQKLETYIGEYHRTAHDDELPDYCPIDVINILTHHYLTVARQHGILLDIRCDLTVAPDPGHTNMADSDLCCLYSNLMENAIEACHRTGTGPKAIRVAVFRIAPDLLNIHVYNTAEQVRQVNGRFLSSKQNGQSGYGLLSIESIVSKYNGSLDVCWKPDDREFVCKVTLTA